MQKLIRDGIATPSNGNRGKLKQSRSCFQRIHKIDQEYF